MFSIFDDRVDNKTKRSMAKKLLEGKESIKYGNKDEKENGETKKTEFEVR